MKRAAFSEMRWITKDLFLKVCSKENAKTNAQTDVLIMRNDVATFPRRTENIFVSDDEKLPPIIVGSPIFT